MTDLPEVTGGELRRLQMAYDYAETIDDSELLRKALAATFALFVQDISEDYERDCIDALRKAVDKMR